MALAGLIGLSCAMAAPGLGAEPVRMPDRFPIPMLFRPYDTLKGDALAKRLDESEFYPVIHAPGPGEKAQIARKRWPEKIITVQNAYGGSMSVNLADIWPGHCLYKAGALLTSDCAENDTVLSVDKPERIARNQNAIKAGKGKMLFYLILYALDDQGRPDWARAEHVQITGLKEGRLEVKRGMLGTKPLALKAGKAAVAAHMMFWSGQWQFNFSLQCPRGGKDNLTAAEWFAKEMAGIVTESDCNGVEFDVGRWTWGFPENAAMDCDNDRIADYGYLGGVNSFGLGGRVFFRELRKLLGPDKIIQVDSNDPIYGPRGWDFLNGIQQECFPKSNDYSHFSDAFRHLRVWSEKAGAAPRFSYGFTKAPTTVFANARQPDGSKTDFRFRIGLAADCMAGAPHPFASIGSTKFDPANDVNEDVNEKKSKEGFGIFVWDEYHGGDLNDWQWLGRPLGPATQDTSGLSPVNLLEKTQWRWTIDKGYEAECGVKEGLASANVKHIPDNILSPSPTNWFAVRLEPAAGTAPALKAGREYTIEFEARGDDRWDYAGQVFERVPRMIALGCDTVQPTRKAFSVLAESEWQPYRLSFVPTEDVPSGPWFGVSEQIGETAILNIRLYEGGGERWRREFENGLVLLNATITPWKTPQPGGMYRRLKGSQAPEVNTGEPVGSEILTPAGDAVFLVKNTASDSMRRSSWRISPPDRIDPTARRAAFSTGLSPRRRTS